MEEATFLMTVQRIVRSIQIERDLARCLGVRVEEQIDQQRLNGVCVGGDFGVTSSALPG